MQNFMQNKSRGMICETNNNYAVTCVKPTLLVNSELSQKWNSSISKFRMNCRATFNLKLNLLIHDLFYISWTSLSFKVLTCNRKINEWKMIYLNKHLYTNIVKLIISKKNRNAAMLRRPGAWISLDNNIIWILAKKIVQGYFSKSLTFINNDVIHKIWCMWRYMHFLITWKANPKIANDLIKLHRRRWFMTLNHKYSYENSFVMLYILKFYLRLERYILFIIDIREV